MDSLTYYKSSSERAGYYIRLSSKPNLDIKNQKKYAFAAIQESKKTKQLKIEVLANLNYAKFIGLSEPSEANKYFKIAKKKAEKDGSPALKLETYSDIGYFYLYWEKYSLLVEIIAQSNALIKKYDLNKRKTLYLLAKMNVQLKKKRKALYFYNELLKLSSIKKQPGIYSEVGNTFYQFGEYIQARTNYLKGLEIAKKYKQDANKEYLYDNIGLTYFQEKNYSKALKYQKKSLFLREKSNSKLAKLTIYANISETYLQLNQADSTLKYAKKGLVIAQNLGLLKQLYSINKTISLSYKKLNKPDISLVYIFKADSVKNLIAAAEKEKHIKSVLLSFRTETQKAQIENMYLKYQQVFFIGSVLSVILLITIIAIVLLYGNYLTKKKYLKSTQKLSTLKSKIFAVLAHDLRSPTNSLKSIIMAFENKNLTQNEFISLLNILTKDVDNMYLTLNNLLQWANGQIQGSKYSPQSIQLHKIIEQHRYMLETKLNEKSITLTNKLPKGLYIYADLEHVHMIFRNLLNNAVKFSFQNGEITITNKLISKKYVQISIADNGTGISKINQTKLFQSNKHLTLKGTNGEKGTGLGLIIVKEMVKANKGSIWVESELKKGSIFHFTLPIQQ